MSNISSVGSTSNMSMMQGMHGMRRPDPTKMAENLFDKLDTGSQGYLQKTDLASAFDSISSSSGSSDVDALFTQLDGDSDGKVTKQEFTSALTQLSEQLDQQFQSNRMQAAMQMGGMPPPPPPNDGGFTKDELSSQLEETGATDSQQSSLISSIVQNFDAADTDGDGKVSFKEAMVFDQSNQAASNNSTAAAGTSQTAASDSEAKVLMQIMQLVQAYMSDDNTRQSSLSVTV